jgi:uncharacterized membrane protein YphA (DoxX/SURF4 family)
MTMAHRNLWWLAAARVYVGALWLTYGTSKFEPNWARTEFLSALKDCIAGTSGPIHALLVNIVVPNQAVFAQAIAAGETLVGFSLIFGLFAKLGALGGMFLSLTYYFATGRYAHRFGLESLELLLFVVCLLLLVLPSARLLSVDSAISRWRRASR